MVDWNKSTGSSGTMRIRDTGTTVEFWITSGNSSTYAYDMPWKYKINGATSSWKEYRYEQGDGFVRLGSWNVTTSQTVTFYLGDTGTSGLGGPTTFSHAISRARAPNAPSTPSIANVTATTMDVSFTDGANNGDAIDAKQLARNTSNTLTGATTIASDGSTHIAGLAQGQTYYWWARTHNSVNWSPWSGSRSAKTLDIPPAPSSVVLSEVQQSSVKAVFAGNGDGGSSILEWQIGYGTSPGSPTSFLSSTGTSTITGLNPGQQYYFWARGRNEIGWGPYSVVSSVTLVAGAYVYYNSAWRRAVPYVRVDGVWRVARSWVRVAGSWRESL